MKKSILLLLFFCFIPAAFAQQVLFSKNYNWSSDDQVRGIKQTPDGGYLLYGSTYNPVTNLEAAYILKTNRQGDSIWIRKNYSPTAWSDARDLIVLADGNLVIAGAKWSFVSNSWDGWLMKTDSVGNKLWEQTYPGQNLDNLNSISQLPSGNFVIAGITESKGAGNRDGWLLKTDSSGNLLWENTYGGQFLEDIIRLKVARNGDFIMAGGTYSFSSNPGVTDDLYLIRVSPQGNLIWQATFGTPNLDWANDLVETPGGGIVAVGLKNNNNTDIFSGQAFFIKTDASGNQLWDKSFALHPLRNEMYNINLTPEGGFLVSGFTTAFNTVGDAFIAKTDSSGNILWDYKFANGNGQTMEVAYAQLQDDEGNFVFAGISVPSPNSPNDLFFIKISDLTVLSQNDNLPDKAVSVYPNPATSELTIKLPFPEKAELTLSDLTGKTIFTGSHLNEDIIKLNTSKVAPGIYLLQINSASKRKLIRVEILK